MSNALFFLLVLACPLMMVFMMRGMHGGHGRGEHDHGADASGQAEPQRERGHGAREDDSLDELKRRRDELDREIAARENADGEVAEEQEQVPQPVA